MSFALRSSFFTFLWCLFLQSALSASPTEMEVARKVIERFSQTVTLPIQLKSLPADTSDCPAYQTSVSNGILQISGSNGVALCKGFYDFVKSQGAGISSWSGNRLEFKGPLMQEGVKRVVSPVPHHYYFNVVTYGYTTPYWNWARWQKEIDWMALHGIDMPLALLAHEAITARVFKKLGLTQDEIERYFVGPAHLPWMRMGNISHLDGPLPEEWHQDQIALQHKILQRMRDLGMTPICPGFSGFVPQAIQRLYPDIKLVETKWGGHFNNWMISPDQALFSTIGELFIHEWEQEFGTCSHYLVDSFNEMDVPFPPHGTSERYQMISDYGEKVYQSIKAASPQAIWVMQGWMFGYQRNIWDEASLRALVSKIPDDKILLLDLAVDYSKHFWRNGANWVFYKGFFNKAWVYSVIPNMGGKTGLTGILDFYANGHLDALQSPLRGNLQGIGMAPEGIENNEVIYELMADAGWSRQPIKLDAWLKNYNLCRYGKSPDALTDYWAGMQTSVYGSFTDHPRYNWQFRPGTIKQGSINANMDFYKAIESFASCAEELKNSPLYQADLAELTAAYVGGKLEILIQASELSMQSGDMETTLKHEAEIKALMLGMDALLQSHPVHRLDLWLGHARNHGSNEELKNYYEKNARRLVTIWGPPIDDYAAKIWSGLIRDYYVPRREEYLKGKFGGKAYLPAWEKAWVENKSGVSHIKPCPDPVHAARQLLARAGKITPDIIRQRAGNVIGTWSPEVISTEWKELSWTVAPKDILQSNAIRFSFTRGDNKLEIDQVKIEMDGKIVVAIKQQGSTGTNHVNNLYRIQLPKDARGNNSCRIIARVRSDGKAHSYGNVELISSKNKEK